jgi:hypothetical protein
MPKDAPEIEDEFEPKTRTFEAYVLMNEEGRFFFEGREAWVDHPANATFWETQEDVGASFPLTHAEMKLVKRVQIIVED